MRIQANTISLMGSLWSLFWYAIYALAIFFIFVSKFWPLIGAQVISRKKLS
jgi:hypothetical protein